MVPKDLRKSLKKKFAVVFVTVYGLCRVPEIESYILSWGHGVFGRKKIVFSGGLFHEALYQSSGSSFRAFSVRTTKES